jgi:hypothetical protein
MKLNGHIDPDLFNIFVWNDIYIDFAKKYMPAHLIDTVRLEDLPGYEEPLGFSRV